jgi:predicted metalloprotease with PDZ domain
MSLIVVFVSYRVNNGLQRRGCSLHSALVVLILTREYMTYKKRIDIFFCSLWLVILTPVVFHGEITGLYDSNSGTGASISYYVHMDKPNTHYFDVSIAVTGIDGDYVDFTMPSWSPGRYMILDFVRHVVREKAVDLKGETLKTVRIDKNTFRVYPRSNGVVFSYSVYANFVSASFSSLSENGAVINGASIFMFVRNRETMQCSLSVYLPPNRGWNLVSALPAGEKAGLFVADNYRHLIDSPITAGAFARYTFECQSVPFHVIFHEKKPKVERSAVIAKIKLICDAAYELFGEFPFRSYYFFFDFGYGPGEWDAMEHRNSMRFTDIDQYDTDEKIMEILRISAHELFHAWNVRATMPRELVWPDLSKEVYCPSLWIVEGSASYYQYILLLRSGILTRAQFRKRICDLIAIFEVSEGRKLISLKESALFPWLDRFGIEDSDRANTTISYYIRGTIVGFLLDMKLRSASGGEKGLDDVQRELYNGFKDNAGGYSEEDFIRLCADIAGDRMRDFIARSVEQTVDLDYSDGVSGSGFVIEKYAGRILPFLGVKAEGKIITWIIPGSPAEAAGLEKFDEIYAISANPVFKDISYLLMKFRVGQRISISVLRNGQSLRVPVTLASHTAYNFRFDEKSGVNASALSAREAYYNGYLKK